MNREELIMNSETVGAGLVSAQENINNTIKSNANTVGAGPVSVQIKSPNAITLIALIITIIIMLILAGVVLNLSIGEHGIFKTAEMSAKNYTNSYDKEIADLNKIDNTISDILDETNKQPSTSTPIDNWKKILELAQIDSSNYNSFEEALQDESVVEKIANINATETLNFVDEENPYYTYELKAGKSYLIQCYGAQGGSYSAALPGGYGGYSFGTINPTKDTTIYIYLGGKGKGGLAGSTAAGGYNGGGAINLSWSDGNEKRATGGGATHIAVLPRLIVKLRK